MPLVVRCPPSHLPERVYVVGVLLSRFLGIASRVEPHDAPHVELRLDGDPAKLRLVLPDGLFAAAPGTLLTDEVLPRPPLSRWDAGRELEGLVESRPLPVLFPARDGRPPGVEAMTDGLRLELDVLGGAFFMLTRLEELVSDQRDEHGRSPVEAALAHRDGFLDRPLADEYADVLRACLTRLWPGLAPARRRGRVLVSHDVDFPLSVRGRTVGQVVRMAGGDTLRRRDLGLAARRLHALARRGSDDLWRHDPAYTFDFMMRTAERLGLRSAFYFLSDPTTRFSGGYSLDEPWVRRTLREVVRRGHEVGWHGSYETLRDPERAGRELGRLRAAAEAEGARQDRWGGRMHFLRWENPGTWQLWEDAGADYDSTVGYAGAPGFRCGTTRSFPVFNLRARRALRLEERPLHVMEVTLLEALRLPPEEAVARAVAVAETCRRHDGDFVLLWHNDSLVSRAQRAAFSDLLGAVA